MLSEQDKRSIYQQLVSSGKFNFDVQYPLSKVGKELTLSGFGCRRFGYSRMKDIMREMDGYIKMDEYEYDGHSNCNIQILRNPSALTEDQMLEKAEEKEEERMPFYGSDEDDEMVSLSVPAAKEEEESEPLTDEIKEEIYRLLTAYFPIGKSIHMAAISKCLTGHGYTPHRFGFSKMKGLLSEMPSYMTLTDTVINQVPNVLITLTRQAGSQNMSSSQDEDSIWATSPRRSSSGSIRFSQESVGTFREDTSYERRARVQRTAPEEETTSQFRTAGSTSSVQEEPREETNFERLTYLPQKVVDYLMTRRGMDNPGKVLSDSYQKSLEEKTYKQNGSTISFPLDFDASGDEMFAVLRRNEKPYGKPWYLSYVGYPKKEQEADEIADLSGDHPTVPGKALESFADIGYWHEFLKELAEQALPEKWDWSDNNLGRYYILKKYIQYTFYRLQMEDKICISPDNQFAAFNTGLVNNHYDEIFACFVPNPLHDKNKQTPAWRFETFALAGIRGKDGYGKMLTSYFDPLPKVAVYFENFADTIYDLDRDLVTDYEHIILDNISRLPMGYLKECMYGDDKAQELIAQVEQAASETRKQQAYYMLRGYIESNDKLYRRLKNRMEDAIDYALKRVRWNFRTVVPCYYPKGNGISLMLPLCLEDDLKTDCALVVQKNPSGSYQGQTILELERAYVDARLVCRLANDWLSMEDISAKYRRPYTPYQNQNRQNSPVTVRPKPFGYGYKMDSAPAGFGMNRYQQQESLQQEDDWGE